MKDGGHISIDLDNGLVEAVAETLSDFVPDAPHAVGPVAVEKTLPDRNRERLVPLGAVARRSRQSGLEA